MKHIQKHLHRVGVVVGLLLVAFGVLLLIDPAFKSVIISWQMLLIVMGLLSLSKRSIVWGIVLIVTGGFFILPLLAGIFPEQFLWLPESFIGRYWAGLIIFAGILIIVKNIWFKSTKFLPDYNHDHNGFNHGKRGTAEGCLDKNLVFSGAEEVFLDAMFVGGEINTVFGGYWLDLRQTSLPEGDTRLEINCVFGGVTIVVPETWKVTMAIDSVFGGATDTRNIDDEKIDKSRKLIVTGACVFGGCDLRLTR